MAYLSQAANGVRSLANRPRRLPRSRSPLPIAPAVDAGHHGPDHRMTPTHERHTRDDQWYAGDEREAPEGSSRAPTDRGPRPSAPSACSLGASGGRSVLGEWTFLKDCLVPKGGLEPPRVAPHAPQTCASANSATSAPAKSKYAVDARGLSMRATLRATPQRPRRSARPT